MTRKQPPKKDWQRIREARTDLTDYVIHFTRQPNSRRSANPPWPDVPLMLLPEHVLREIVRHGSIRPTFARIRLYGRADDDQAATITVVGPKPAVCLTEQPLSAVLQSLPFTRTQRYSGYGIAYHKFALYSHGARPVLYASRKVLGKPLKPTDAGFQQGKEIYGGGMPAEMQYLWVRYEPIQPGRDDYPKHFTWEREWRFGTYGDGLPIVMANVGPDWPSDVPVGALVVERDADVPAFADLLNQQAATGDVRAAKLKLVVSLETAKRGLDAGDPRFGRIETWPRDALGWRT